MIKNMELLPLVKGAGGIRAIAANGNFKSP